MRYTLLKDEQIWGGDALEVMKAYGTKVAPTDLAVLLGAWVTENEDQRTREGELTCQMWTASTNHAENVLIVDTDGDRLSSSPMQRRVATRPILPASETHKIHPRCEKNSLLSNGKNLRIAEWGEYPQTVVSAEISKTLDIELSTGRLKKTGKKYTFDSVGITEDFDKFNPMDYPEYEFEGKKYIHLIVQQADEYSVLSTGEKVEEGRDYWVEVQPVEWLVDPTGIWIAKKALIANIQLDTNWTYDDDFNNTFMNKYLNEFFSKELREKSDE